MKKEVKIRHISSSAQIIMNLIQSIAHYNASGEGLTDTDAFEANVRSYINRLPKGIFDYTFQTTPETFTLFEDGLMCLSIQFVDVYELEEKQIVAENY